MTPAKTPAARKKFTIPTQDELEEWLKAMHCTLWGRSFTLQKEGLHNASSYFLEQIASFEEWRKTGVVE